jgi:hypothetical protein
MVPARREVMKARVMRRSGRKMILRLVLRGMDIL